MIRIDEHLSRSIANAGFLCACLVVCLHVDLEADAGTWRWWLHDIVRSVAKVAVPGFFAISGFLLAGHFGESGWWGRAVRKRVRSLVVPYIIWNEFYLVLSVLLTALAARIGFRFGGISIEEFDVSLFVSSLGIVPPWDCQLVYLWFVRCLFVFVCVAPLFTFVQSRIWGCPILILLFAVYASSSFWLPPAEDWRVHFMKMAWMKGVCYFSLGAFLRWQGGAVRDVIERLPGGHTIVGLGRSLPLGGMWPAWMTSCAFPVFLLHKAVITLLVGVWQSVGIKAVILSSVTAYFLQVVVVILICIGVTNALRRHCSKLAGFLFGGR